MARVCVAAVAALLGLTSGALAAPRPDPTCDFPAQAAPAYRPTGDETPARRTPAAGTATVCEHTSGVQGMEPMLAVDRRGTLFMGMATDKGLYEQPGELGGTAENALLRSRNDGRTWHRIPLPGGINASEGFPYIDPVTDRLFVTSLGVDAAHCGQPVIYSDDEGATWSVAAAPPGCSPPTLGDWPKIFSGPFRGAAPGAYPTAVYECNFIPNILVAASIGCWRSDDGGDHFAFAGYLPTVNGLCTAGNAQGGTGATIVNGSGRVLAGGDVIVPLTVCGKPAVVRSSDEGQTWEGVATGGQSLGLEDVLALREGLVLAVTDHVWSENLAVDARDNLYMAYIRDGVHLMASRDGGRTWRHLGVVTPPGLVHAILVSVTARRAGEVALTFYATPDKGDALGATGMNWRAWMTYSADALAAKPRFRSAPTSPESAPAMSASMPGCCTTDETFLEYTGVKFVSQRQIRGAFTRWTGKHLPELVLTKLRLPRTCGPRHRHCRASRGRSG
ncbi:MAG: repeat-like domain [Solirubrobacteraceae bacterium]|nr:repeat-like domain [Solirubrobacteraceae bacterium]